MTVTVNFNPPRCSYCGSWHVGVCPRVKAYEYHEDGTLKRVEFHGVEASRACDFTDPVTQEQLKRALAS